MQSNRVVPSVKVVYSFSYSCIDEVACGDANSSGEVDIDDIMFIVG